MLCSVFTPTHDPRWLRDAHQSLCAQTHEDWEWVILPNGSAFGAGDVEIPGDITRDRRVRVIPARADWDTGYVGALKRAACDHAQGEIFVELDHDDLLTSRCLERIVGAVENGADFVYSDFVSFHEDGTFQTYDPGEGWETYTCSYDGKTVIVNRAFDPTPRALHEIWWGPNHVRAWRASTYQEVGGHDPALDICDDMDLVIRTYLAGARFHCVREPLYLYREHADGSNTYLERSERIRAMGRALSDRYTTPLVREWCQRNNHPAIRLRSGPPAGSWSTPDGFTDVQVDLPSVPGTFELPFATDSIGALHAYDWLHRAPQEDVVRVMNEIYRVLVPGGWLISNTPSSTGQGVADPRGRSHWNPFAFAFFLNANMAATLGTADCQFQAARIGEYFPAGWLETHKIPYVIADLIALKPGYRGPGRVGF